MWTSPLLAAVLLLSAEQPLNDLWNDPTFQKQFMGSYGFQAELEPKLTVLERQELEKILTLMASDTDAAMAALKKAATPDASAVFNYTRQSPFSEGRTRPRRLGLWHRGR